MTLEELKRRFISYVAERYVHRERPVSPRDFIRSEAAKAGIEIDWGNLEGWERMLNALFSSMPQEEIEAAGMMRLYNYDVYHHREDKVPSKEDLERWSARAEELRKDPYLYDPEFVPRKTECID